MIASYLQPEIGARNHSTRLKT